MIELLLIINIAIALYIAFGVGANDETMAPLAGSGLITVERIVILISICNFIGAVLLGSKVEKTIGTGIVNNQILPVTLEITLIVILAEAIWLTIASTWGWPVSTTHSMVGAVLGLALFFKGLEAINLKTVSIVLVNWIISPIIGLITALILSKAISKFALKKVKGLRTRENIERTSALILAFAAFMNSFSRAGNDVANASALLSTVTGEQYLIRSIAASGMVAGLLILGRRVIRSVGLKIVELTPSSALAAQATAAIIATISVLLGLPLSGTHVLVAAIIGSALARGTKISLSAVKQVMFSWVVTFPASGFFAILIAGIAIHFNLIVI
ncbi:inorganic phosphate transporter [Candidatus Bathyarchaeota archaeon]|nr:inorganic phosphate transporter [Candidatus Bathyarchaeota archaeon]